MKKSRIYTKTKNDLCSRAVCRGVANAPETTDNQYRQSEAIVEQFWKRWLKEYVPHLTERRKWTTARRNVEVGDLVLIIEPNTPRCQCPLGQVLKTYSDKGDNVVRVVKVKAASHPKPFARPVTKLCILTTAAEQALVVKKESKSKPVRRVHFKEDLNKIFFNQI